MNLSLREFRLFDLLSNNFFFVSLLKGVIGTLQELELIGQKQWKKLQEKSVLSNMSQLIWYTSRNDFFDWVM